jgi:hypothetical protein
MHIYTTVKARILQADSSKNTSTWELSNVHLGCDTHCANLKLITDFPISLQADVGMVFQIRL